MDRSHRPVSCPHQMPALVEAALVAAIFKILSIVRCLALFVFPHRYRSFVADSAVRPRLRGVNRCAAPAAPCHVSDVACAPHRADRPAWVGVVGAAGWWHDDTAALGVHDVTDEVVGKSSCGSATATLYLEPPTGRPRCADSSTQREFPSDKVYRRDDRGLVGVETFG